MRLTPLTTADIRGFAVGMLAGDQHYAQAPDRWAPERILVEIDGRIVYDSDENPIDRKSLAAIRLIPPAHLDETGKLVVNDKHSEREFSLWEAGRAQGLDLEHGGAKPLPPPDDPGFPKGEPVSPTDPPPAGDFGGGAGFPPIPGELPGPGDGGLGSGGFGPDAGFGPGPGGFGLGGGFGGGPYNPLWDLLWHLLFNGNGNGGGGSGNPNQNPPSTGTPPTVSDVVFTSGWKTNDPFAIKWTVTGDKSKITETIVQLWDCHPEAPFPYGPNLLASKSVAGSGPVILTVNQPVATSIHYFVPQVTIKLKDNSTNSEYGPARPVFPPYTIPLVDKTMVHGQYDYWDGGNVKHTLPLTTAPGPASGRGVWTLGKTGTDTDLRIDDSAQQDLAHNVVILHDAADKKIRVVFGRVINQKTRITMYYGAAKRGAGDLGNGPFPISWETSTSART